MGKGKKRSGWKRWWWLPVLGLIAIGGLLGMRYYGMIYASNVDLDGSDPAYFYITSDWSYEQVLDGLAQTGWIADIGSLRWVAGQKNYAAHIRPGKYRLKNGMSNDALINMLRSGAQEPVNVQFHSIRTKRELAGRVAAQIEADSAELMQLMNDNAFLGKYGFGQAEVLALFIPNTYEFYWNTSAEAFFQRMAREFKAFWTDERKAKARKAGLSQSQVATLASIVQAEQSNHRDERPKVAGLYVNRLQKGMRLQADPTIIYALQDFSIRRVLNVHKEVDSPYNTYRHTGLPPGPINLPEIASLDAVLNHEQHNYLYMCAKPDFSGYHNFAKTYEQHLVNARKFQRELNKRKIYR